MALKSGFENLANSMANEMFEAFKTAWPKYIEDTPAPTKLNPQMELMFVAIARGVVKHLKENPDAFKVIISNHTGHNHSIQNAGSTLSGGNHAHTASVAIEGE